MMKAASKKKSVAVRGQRSPQTVSEARSFLERMLERDESFHLTAAVIVSRSGRQITRSERFDLYWWQQAGEQTTFQSHSLTRLLEQFIAWRSIAFRPSNRLKTVSAAVVDTSILCVESI